MQYEPHTSQEFIYLQSVLSGWMAGYNTDLGQWNRFLGMSRTLTAYGNQRIYAWFLNCFMPQIKNYRKKHGEVIKAIAQLPFHQVKEGSVYGERLCKAGYSRQEIIFLNMNLPNLSNSRDRLFPNSIAMERIVAQGCQNILNAEKVESPLLFEEVVRFLSVYAQFQIRLEGTDGLTQLLRDQVSLQDSELFLYLYQRKENRTICREWFRVDLSEEKWEILADILTAEQYADLFEECFYFRCNNREDAWLEKYEKLCGEPYYGQLWKSQREYTDNVFRILVRTGKFDLVVHLKQYAQERDEADVQAVEEKWHYIFLHILAMVKKIDCYENFRFWETYEQLFGMEALRKFLGDWDRISEVIGFKTYSSSRGGAKLWQGLEFLSIEDQRKLFYWECDELYWHNPSYYNKFLLQFLLEKGMDLFTREQCREVADVLLAGLSENSCYAKELRSLYYTDEELAAYEEHEEQQKREAEKRRAQKQREDWMRELKKGVDADDRVLSALSIIGKNAMCRWRSKEYYEIAYSYIKEELEQGNCRVESSQLTSFLELMGTIVLKKVSTWEETCKMIQKLEVVDDGSTED